MFKFKSHKRSWILQSIKRFGDYYFRKYNKVSNLIREIIERYDLNKHLDMKDHIYLVSPQENDETVLPTPLNIKDFASDTGYGNPINNTVDREKLFEIIYNKSQSTAREFAKDIKEMSERGQTSAMLFLCFPFISYWFGDEFVKTEYNIRGCLVNST